MKQLLTHYDTVPRFRRELKKTFLFRQSYPSIVF